MTRNDEIRAMADIIVRNNGGRAYFNFAEAAEIIGCGRNTLAYDLHNAGILIKKVGPSKRLSALDIAEYMRGDTAPIDNMTAKGAASRPNLRMCRTVYIRYLSRH